MRRDRDSNPGSACADNGFRDRPVQPLWHLSVKWPPKFEEFLAGIKKDRPEKLLLETQRLYRV
jgi:hypothetical protein